MIKKIKTTLIIIALGLSIIGCSKNYLQKEYRAKTIFKDADVLDLTLAAKNGNTQKIDDLIANGVDVNAEGERGYTPLYWIFAYVSPNPDTKRGFQHLLQNGANAMVNPKETQVPLLHFASEVEDSDYLKLILKYGTNIDLNQNISTTSWSNPLLHALITGERENFKILIDGGANVNGKDINGRPVLTYTTNAAHWDLAYYLLQNEADYNVESEVTEFNPDGLPEIVRSLETGDYSDYLASSKNGDISDREKVIKFLKDRGVEVYPYHKKDDPRYNPRPKKTEAKEHTPLNNEAEKVINLFEECLSTENQNPKKTEITDLKDINLYKDISPNNYSRESENIYGLAMINLKGFFRPNNDFPNIIKAEFFSEYQDLYSQYFYDSKTGKIKCVLKKEDQYSTSKANEGSKIETSTQKNYIILPNACFKINNNQQPEQIAYDECNNLKTDAETYTKAFTLAK